MVLTRFTSRPASASGLLSVRPGARRPLDGTQLLRRAREAAFERAAIAVCLVLAVGSGGFAAYAVSGTARDYAVQRFLPPTIAGFAWKRELAPAQTAALDLDPLITGSLAERATSPEAEAVPAERAEGGAPARGYVLRRVSGGIAVVEGPSGLRQVGPGAVLPGAGRVVSIRFTGAGWVVVTSETIIGPTPL